MYILKTDVNNANNLGGQQANVWKILLFWLGYPIVLFLIQFLIIKKVPALIKDGRVFAIVMIILVAVFTYGLLRFFPAMLIAGMDEQQDALDRRRRRVRFPDDAERVGNHLAGQQANHRRLARRTARRA